MIDKSWRDLIRQYRMPALSEDVTKTAGLAALERQFGDPMRLSNSGKCARRLAYQKFHHAAMRYSLESPFPPEPLQGRALLVFELGDRVEESLKAWIAKAGSLFQSLAPPHDRVSIKVAGVEISGHPDGWYQERDGSMSLVSIKSINALSFDRVDRDGPEYEAVCQDTAYMAALNLQKARFLYYNKNTSHVADDWVVEFSADLFTEITNRWARVIGADLEHLPEPEHQAGPETEWIRGLGGYKSGSMPSGDVTLDSEGKRVTEVKKNGYWRETGRKKLPWPCAYCPWKGPCYGAENLTMEMNGDSPVWYVKDKRHDAQRV